jgi:hypothetical protein
VSVATLRAIEDAILAHHRETCDPEQPERASAVVTAWVVSYEIANVVDVGPEHGGSVLGYANSYVTSDCSPNTLAHLAHWAGDVIDGGIPGPDDD